MRREEKGRIWGGNMRREEKGRKHGALVESGGKRRGLHMFVERKSIRTSHCRRNLRMMDLPPDCFHARLVAGDTTDLLAQNKSHALALFLSERGVSQYGFLRNPCSLRAVRSPSCIPRSLPLLQWHTHILVSA